MITPPCVTTAIFLHTGDLRLAGRPEKRHGCVPGNRFRILRRDQRQFRRFRSISDNQAILSALRMFYIQKYRNPFLSDLRRGSDNSCQNLSRHPCPDAHPRRPKKQCRFRRFQIPRTANPEKGSPPSDGSVTSDWYIPVPGNSFCIRIVPVLPPRTAKEIHPCGRHNAVPDSPVSFRA